MSSLTLKAKKLKNKSKDSCKKRKYKRYDRYFCAHDVLSIKERPLSPLEETMLRHCQYALDSQPKINKRRLKGVAGVYFYKPLKDFVKNLKDQLNVETSKSSAHRALTRIEALGFIISGIYNEKRYYKHGGRLALKQDSTKSYTITAKGRKYLKNMHYLNRLKSSGKAISKYNISDKTPVFDSSAPEKELKENSTAAQGSTLEIQFLRREMPETEAETYFYYKLGAAIPKPLKTALWKEYKAEDHKLESKGSRVRNPIAWARSKNYYNWTERSIQANERYAATKDSEEELLGREASLRGIIVPRGKQPQFTHCREFCDKIVPNLQNNKPSTATPKIKPYKAIAKAAPPEEVCEYLEGYSVSINNMLPFVKSKDESSISSMISCGVWGAADVQVARRLAKEKWGV